MCEEEALIRQNGRERGSVALCSLTECSWLAVGARLRSVQFYLLVVVSLSHNFYIFLSLSIFT